jgi:acyl-ACP thioesterase
MSSIYTEERLIRAYEIDFQNELKLNAVFNIMQEAASTHAENMGLGFEDLKKNDLAWVLSWAKIHVEQSAIFGEKILVTTWPKTKHRLFSIRDFHITNAQGETVALATTAWLLINTKTKKITELAALPENITYQSHMSAIDDFPEKMTIGSDKKLAYSKIIRYTDIDINGHVNNTKYVELILDCFGLEKFRTESIEEAVIRFSSESFEHDTILMYVAPSDKGGQTIEGVYDASKQQSFISTVRWRTKPIKNC